MLQGAQLEMVESEFAARHLLEELGQIIKLFYRRQRHRHLHYWKSKLSEI